jgi:predicted transcriptional regulator
MNRNGLSRREREIVDILHRLGSATVAEIEEAMSDPPTNSAVRSILRVLRTKGHVRYEERGTRYIYYPSVPRPAAARSALHGVLETFFGGSLTSAVESFLSDEDTALSEAELAELEELIARAKTKEEPHPSPLLKKGEGAKSPLRGR